MVREHSLYRGCTLELNETDQANLFRYQLGIEETTTKTTGEFAVSGGTFYIEYERKLYRWTYGGRKWHDTGMQDTPVFADFYAANGFQFAASGRSYLPWKKQRHSLPIVGWWSILGEILPRIFLFLIE